MEQNGCPHLNKTIKVDLDRCNQNKKGYIKTNLWSSESGPLDQLDEIVSKYL